MSEFVTDWDKWDKAESLDLKPSNHRPYLDAVSSIALYEQRAAAKELEAGRTASNLFRAAASHASQPTLQRGYALMESAAGEAAALREVAQELRAQFGIVGPQESGKVNQI